MANGKVIAFDVGAPGGEAIKDCITIMLDATKAVLHTNADAYDIFKYGEDGGDRDCIDRVAQFLSIQYGIPVSSDTLILTAGATQGLHFLLTTLMASSKLVFIEDPAYFYVIPMMRDDLQKTLVPVPRDKEGMIPEVLDDLLTAHKPNDWRRIESGPHYWSCVYFVPTFNNPTSQTYSNARLQQLVTLAKKHDVLLIAEDLYRFLPFSEEQTTSASLLHTFDNNNDPDYNGGHLVSNSSFSKVLAPGLRLGWIEGPTWMIKQLAGNFVSKSGGCFNHYTSKLVSEIIRNGREQEQIKNVKKIYKKRMVALIQTMRENLPEGCSFQEPLGGFYLWIALRPETDAAKFNDFALQKYDVGFLPGSFCSASGGYKNYLRISIAAWDLPDIIEGAKRFCKAYTEFLTLNSNL